MDGRRQKKIKLSECGKWTDEKLIRLFELHEANPMLWNRSDPKYMDTIGKARLLEEIGKELDCSAEEAKLRFRSMKQTFQKNCKKSPKYRNGDRVQKEWRFARNLSFLFNESSKAEQTDNLIEYEESMTSNEVDQESNEPEFAKSEEAYPILKDPFANCNPRDGRDNSMIYGEYVASKHRKYNAHTQSVVEHLIGNILFNADMGKYDRNVPSSS